MFGYVTPCKMELKIKDFEKFKAYYCGLCTTIKSNFGNLPRLALNYDMTFLAVLLDSLNDEGLNIKKHFCSFHPMQKRLILIENSPIQYAAFCNVTLAYHKLLDNAADDNSKLSKIYSSILNIYLKKAPKDYYKNIAYIENSLKELSIAESNAAGRSLDELSHCFADLTGYILSSYYCDNILNENLYWLGYNLGKWIYIIDAFDDLEKDMKNNKFNAINSVYNLNNGSYDALVESIKDRVEFTLISCAQACLDLLNRLPVKKNYDLLHNILQLGLMEKMDKVFRRDIERGTDYEKSI
jgi:hypothetical protein